MTCPGSNTQVPGAPLVQISGCNTGNWAGNQVGGSDDYGTAFRFTSRCHWETCVKTRPGSNTKYPVQFHFYVVAKSNIRIYHWKFEQDIRSVALMITE